MHNQGISWDAGYDPTTPLDREIRIGELFNAPVPETWEQFAAICHKARIAGKHHTSEADGTYIYPIFTLTWSQRNRFSRRSTQITISQPFSHPAEAFLTVLLHTLRHAENESVVRLMEWCAVHQPMPEKDPNAQQFRDSMKQAQDYLDSIRKPTA